MNGDLLPADAGTDLDDPPLVRIERRVQEHARQLELDVAGHDGRRRLAALIDDEIGRWDDEFRRGTRPVAIGDPDALRTRALRNLAGYGPLQPLLEDEDVWEIMVNAPDAIFVKRHRGADGYHDEVFHDDDHVFRTLTKILDDASGAHRKLDPTLGLQDAQLDSGARLHIVHRDLSRGGHLMVNVRKFTGATAQIAHYPLEKRCDRPSARATWAEDRPASPGAGSVPPTRPAPDRATGCAARNNRGFYQRTARSALAASWTG